MHIIALVANHSIIRELTKIIPQEFNQLSLEGFTEILAYSNPLNLILLITLFNRLNVAMRKVILVNLHDFKRAIREFR